MEFSKEFKEELSLLSPKEKDRLVLRLLKRDEILAHRYYYQLIDDRSLAERRREMEEIVDEMVEEMSENYSNAHYLKSDMRSVSGLISRHLKITADKFGEISLNLQLLIQVLERNNYRLIDSYQRSEKCHMYIVTKAFRMLILMNKQHPDLLLEFKPALEQLGGLIEENKFLAKMCKENGLKTHWLTEFEVPENSYEIYKDLKARGRFR